MSLSPGTRLDLFEILAPLGALRLRVGAGRPVDIGLECSMRLGRDVAAKVLPAGSVGNAQAEARFDRDVRCQSTSGARLAITRRAQGERRE